MTQHLCSARTLTGALLGVAALVLATLSSAQDRYPSKPVQIIAPVSAGSAVDIISRIYAERLSKRLGQQFLVISTSNFNSVMVLLRPGHSTTLCLPLLNLVLKLIRVK